MTTDKQSRALASGVVTMIERVEDAGVQICRLTVDYRDCVPDLMFSVVTNATPVCVTVALPTPDRRDDGPPAKDPTNPFQWRNELKYYRERTDPKTRRVCQDLNNHPLRREFGGEFQGYYGPDAADRRKP